MIPQKLFQTMAVLATLVLAVLILVYARPFLVPGAFALLLALLLLPLARWFQLHGTGRGLGAFCSVLILLLAFGSIVLFVSWQFSNILGDVAKMEQLFAAKFRQLQAFASEKLGMSSQKQLAIPQPDVSGALPLAITGLLAGAGGLVAHTILVFVYTFLLLYFRGRLRQFVLRVVPAKETGTAVSVLHDVQRVSQKYLVGLALMIGSLWVMYGIGFSIAGVKNPLFFAILCGLLEIVPFVGNIAGSLLTVGMALVQGASDSVILGIVFTYGLVQFLQTYLIEPLVVGAEVNLNPLFTIVAIVAGEQIWGIPGMILAVPLLGMAKIICDHIEPLKPYGYLVGEDPKAESGLHKKLKQWFGQRNRNEV
jgi:predicted PurR-regulated permease PerM